MKTLKMKLAVAAFLFMTIAIAPQAAIADSFELFTASGTFIDWTGGQPPATLSGSFVVDLTTGLVVSADLFHGTTELNLIRNQGPNEPTLSGVYGLGVINLDGDLLGLVLAAPNNMGSLSNYTGGPICSVWTSFSSSDGPECRSSLGAVASAFTSHLTAPEADDLYMGVVTDVGPTSVPEPETIVLAGTATALCLLCKYLTNLRGTD